VVSKFRGKYLSQRKISKKINIHRSIIRIDRLKIINVYRFLEMNKMNKRSDLINTEMKRFKLIIRMIIMKDDKHIRRDAYRMRQITF
jgi:hypothetical protein